MRYYRSTETGAVWTEQDMRSSFKDEVPDHWQEVWVSSKRKEPQVVSKVAVSIIASGLVIAAIAGSLALAVLAVRFLIGAFA